MLVIFVHGWSVTNTETYGELPAYLKQLAGFETASIYLGKYVSFEDTVTVTDLARAFEYALRNDTDVAAKLKDGERVACITHSTGGPVIRQWIYDFYGKDLKKCPLSHLVMLAPANHGSALAQLGKQRLGRLKAFMDHIEPGQRVLDWLELGSTESWDLNTAWMQLDCVGSGLYPFVLTGQSIDRNLYDVLNSYTDEQGSDGVVRVAGANLNYTLLRLRQEGKMLKQVGKAEQSARCVLAVLPRLSHSGKKMGIIRSVTLNNAETHPTVQWVLRCLGVTTATGYRQVMNEADTLTAQTLKDEKKETAKIGLFSRTFDRPQCTMMVVRLSDDANHFLTDYELRITAGPNYDPQSLPKGFFIDRQRNSRNAGKLTYYLNYDVFDDPKSSKVTRDLYGFDVTAYPERGLAHYQTARFQSQKDIVGKILRPNETLMVDIQVQRLVDQQVFRLTTQMPPDKISDVPSGQYVD
jgi:hypothetical protein